MNFLSKKNIFTGGRANTNQVGGALARASAFRVGLDVAGAVIAPGLRACPSRSCDGWVCGLGTVVASLVFLVVDLVVSSVLPAVDGSLPSSST